MDNGTTNNQTTNNGGKMKKVNIPILSAAAVVLIGIIDILIKTDFSYGQYSIKQYTGLFSGILKGIVFVTGINGFYLAIIFWLILAVGVFIFVKNIKHMSRKFVLIFGMSLAAVILLVSVTSVIGSNGLAQQQARQEAHEAALSATANSDISKALTILENELLSINSMQNSSNIQEQAEFLVRTSAVNELMREYQEFEKRMNTGEVKTNELVKFAEEFYKKVTDTVK